MSRFLLRFLILPFLILFFFSSPLLLTRGNPIPSDYNYGTIPLASNYDNSVYFKSEVIIFRFTSSRVFINANYTFANGNSSSVGLNILLPFVISGSKETNPLLLESLLLDGLPVDYVWKTIQIPSISTYGDFQALELFVYFDGEEEHTVNIHYNRDYQDGAGTFTSNTAEYNFRYCVGTALTWNHNIDSADFEFWIPKSICNDINSDRYFDTFEEEDKFFVGNLKYSDWLPEEEFITIWWTDTVLITGMQQIFLLFGMGIIGALVGTGGLIYFLKRKF